MLEKITNIQCSIKNIIGHFSPKIGIVLGSGLSSFADSVNVVYSINYSDIKGMPHSTVEGHVGRFLFGYISDVPVVVMQGRFHYYEGWSPEEVVLPIRLMKLLGIETLMLSNAAGGINTTFKVGDIMIIKDHISFIPNPLIGKNISELGDRFPAMGCAYSSELIEKAEQNANILNIALKKGVYVAVTGPSYETPAEIGYYRMIGGDAVGMSTAPEVIAATHMNLKVFAVSVITNVHNQNEIPNHKEVVEQGLLASKKLLALFHSLITA